MPERACAAIVRKSSILMVRHLHDGRDYWTLPGGGVEPGARPEQAVLREVREEVAPRGLVTRLLFEHDIQRVREYCFLVAIDEGQEPRLGYDPELARDRQMLTAVAWCPLEQVGNDRQVSKVLTALRRFP
jgi:8-oxo-dGTP diphosphatase